MIYWILGYIVTLIGCRLFVYIENDGMTIGGLLITIIFSIIPLLGQFLAFVGILALIVENYDLSWIIRITNKKLF